MIPVEAVEAAAKAHHSVMTGGGPDEWGYLDKQAQDNRLYWMSAALEAAAPHMQQEVDLMRWKLDALKEWADAMIDESYYPQYGRDVKTILDVSRIEATKADFGDG